MATPFRIKRSAVPGKRPVVADLQLGELALNTYDGNLFAQRDTGGVGIGTTVSLLTPWIENYGGQSIFYNQSVGIGTTNPTSKLQVERYGVSSGFGTFSATAGISTDIDTFTISSIDFKTIEYTLDFNNGNNIQTQKVLVMQNGTIAYSQEYGIMFEPNLIVSIGATVSSGVCKLQATPETGISGITTYRIVRQGLL